MSVIKVNFQKLQQVKAAKKLSSYGIAAIAREQGKPIAAETVQKIVSGKHEPKAVNLKKICDVLEIPIGEIFIDAAA